MTTYYLTPSSWRRDEYRDIATEDNIRDQYDAWKADGDPEWESWEDARDECDPLDATTKEEAEIEAFEIAGTDLNPEDRPSMQLTCDRCGQTGLCRGDMTELNDGTMICPACERAAILSE